MVRFLRQALYFFPLLTHVCWAAFIKVPNTQYYAKWDDLTDHPGYKPFISHLTFRNVCNHRIDQNTEWFDPDQVLQGDTIYLNAWYLDWFAEKVHDQIRYPYILVCADVGSWLPLPTMPKKLLYDPKLAAWFCRNIIFSNHPKFFQIPMGQDFALFDFWDLQARTHLLNALENGYQEKEHLLYMNFSPRSFGDRDLIVQLFENRSYCFSRNRSDQNYTPIDHPTYFEDLSRSRFTLSPLGLETDCVRTWEALVLGSIPIVEHTFLDPLYEGLPVVIVDDWEEIDPLFLEQKYQELKHLKNEKAYFPYWEERLYETQNRVKENDLSFAHLEATAFCLEDLKILKDLLVDFNTLIYKGGLTAIRPLQLVSNCSFLSSILIYDPWLDNGTASRFNLYTDKMTVVEIPRILDGPQTLFNDLLMRTPNPYAVFLDLTYYRHSLMTDFTVEFQKPRHLLKRDLKDLYNQLPIFALLVGNEAQNPYVRKMVTMFSRESGAQVEFVGSFWHVRKIPFFHEE